MPNENWIKITDRQPPYGKLVYTRDDKGNIGAYTRYHVDGVGDGWTSLISTDNNAIVEWLDGEDLLSPPVERQAFAGFQFESGALVTHKATGAIGIVVNRILVEAPTGNTGHMYSVSDWNGYARRFEIELEKYRA